MLTVMHEVRVRVLVLRYETHVWPFCNVLGLAKFKPPLPMM